MKEFYEIFNNINDIRYNFIINDKDMNQLNNANHIFAYYDYQDCSGEAFVLFQTDGVWYENGGGHCSCNGLEDQWSPTKTTLDSVSQYSGYGEPLKEFIKKVK